MKRYSFVIGLILLIAGCQSSGPDVQDQQNAIVPNQPDISLTLGPTFQNKDVKMDKYAMTPCDRGAHLLSVTLSGKDLYDNFGSLYLVGHYDDGRIVYSDRVQHVIAMDGDYEAGETAQMNLEVYKKRNHPLTVQGKLKLAYLITKFTLEIRKNGDGSELDKWLMDMPQ